MPGEPLTLPISAPAARRGSHVQALEKDREGLCPRGAAETLVAGKAWLPAALRTAAAQAPETPEEDGENAGSPPDDDYAFAAE